MAEILFKERLKQSGRIDAKVESAGLGALIDHPADKNAIEILAEKGMDLTAHKGRQLNAEMIKQADLILVMESSQKRAIEASWPFSRGKVYRLGEWGRYDIDDPYQKNRAAFVTSYKLIEKGVSDWLDRLDLTS